MRYDAIGVVSGTDLDTIVIEKSRLDALARAFGTDQVESGQSFTPLWYWVSHAPVCNAGSSIRVRLFRPIMAGEPIVRTMRSRLHGNLQSEIEELHQRSVCCVQTVRTSGTLRESRFRRGEFAINEAIGIGDMCAVVELLRSPDPVVGANTALAALCAHRLQRRYGGQVIALDIGFHSAAGDVDALRLISWVEVEGRIRFELSAPRRPPIVAGLAWFGCGGGGSWIPNGAGAAARVPRDSQAGSAPFARYGVADG